MNREKIAEYVQNMFRLENMNFNDLYSWVTLSSSHWPIEIMFRIEENSREAGVALKYKRMDYHGIISTWEDENTAGQNVITFIAKILEYQARWGDADTLSDMGNILAWPYNCNLTYIPHILNELNNKEEQPDVPVKNSRTIKSSIDNKYGFHLKDEVIWDNAGNYWTMDTWFNNLCEPYKDFNDAKNSMITCIADSGLDDSITDPEDYAWAFTEFAQENVPNYIEGV